MPAFAQCKEIKESGTAWLQERGMSCDHRIKAHFGPVTAGPIGTRSEKRFDVFGETVNTAALLNARGVAITPQVFRKLTPEITQAFQEAYAAD